MITLRPAPHTSLIDTVVEVWDNGNFIAAIYPTPNGIKIISKYIENRADLVTIEVAEPPAVLIKLVRKEEKTNATYSS